MSDNPTPHFDPVFEYWREFPTLEIWEIASMMKNVEPRVLTDVTDECGDKLDFTHELRLLASSVLAGHLTALPATLSPNQRTAISTASLLPWLRAHQYNDLANGLDHDATGASAQPRSSPAQRQITQEAAILHELKARGYDPLALPRNKAGKPGVKAEIRKAIGTGGMWSSAGVFDKAWERLRGSAQIVDRV